MTDDRAGVIVAGWARPAAWSALSKKATDALTAGVTRAYWRRCVFADTTSGPFYTLRLARSGGDLGSGVAQRSGSCTHPAPRLSALRLPKTPQRRPNRSCFMSGRCARRQQNTHTVTPPSECAADRWASGWVVRRGPVGMYSTHSPPTPRARAAMPQIPPHSSAHMPHQQCMARALDTRARTHALAH